MMTPGRAMTPRSRLYSAVSFSFCVPVDEMIDAIMVDENTPATENISGGFHTNTASNVPFGKVTKS